MADKRETYCEIFGRRFTGWQATAVAIGCLTVAAWIIVSLVEVALWLT